MEKHFPSLDFRLKEIDETRNYFLEKIKHSELVSKKHKKTCFYLLMVFLWELQVL